RHASDLDALFLPTRRSSDLFAGPRRGAAAAGFAEPLYQRQACDGDRCRWLHRVRVVPPDSEVEPELPGVAGAERGGAVRHRAGRSEEHTSELQSRENLV